MATDDEQVTVRETRKIRLDQLLFDRGFAESRERAKALVMRGSVFIGDNRAAKPGMQVNSNTEIAVRADSAQYVSRGGQKLHKALEVFGASVEGRVCIDCGASTGGFTDCLLQNGAALVYAVDVGYGQLAWKLRSDPRVVVMERTNIRYLTRDKIDPTPSLAVVDLSFISLKLILPVVKPLLTDAGEAICLIKPQFEAGREKVGKKGVVRDPETHTAVLNKFISDAEGAGFCVKGLTFSPVRGPEGNIEYLSHLCVCGPPRDIDTSAVVKQSHEELI